MLNAKTKKYFIFTSDSVQTNKQLVIGFSNILNLHKSESEQSEISTTIRIKHPTVLDFSQSNKWKNIQTPKYLWMSAFILRLRATRALQWNQYS